MLRKILFVLVFVFGLLTVKNVAQIVSAGSLSSVTVGLDRVKASTATSGLVCATTPGSDNGTEADVQVTFPTGFTVNSAGNWTISTGNIPSGATAWPGVSTATSVSGQTVTFPSNNLSAGTTYCFRWTSTGALTTPSSQTSNSGTVATRTGGGSTIDSGSYALPTITNDQVSVSATVPFDTDDFEAEVTTSTTGEPYEQDTEVTIQVDYTSNIAYATPLSVEAEWSLGTISGSGSPTVTVVEYVVGSASNAYGSAAPVIDTVNRTITWDISSFPAGETASVTFKLRTTSNYKGSSQVSWDVEGRVLAQDVQSADDTLTLTYKYVAPITPTPTPGPTNTPTPGPAPTSSVTSTPTPTPTTAPIPFAFRTIDVSRIRSNLIEFLVTTTHTSAVTVRYGISPDKLTETARSVTPRSRHEIAMSPLDADTPYYFRFEATNSAGRTIRSDLYIATTAGISEIPSIDARSLVVVSNNVILLQNANTLRNTVVIPKETVYSFRFSFGDDTEIEEMRVEVTDSKVLGIFDVFAQTSPPAETGAVVVETSPGLYNALLKTPLKLGTYEVRVKTRDTNGNLDSQNLFNVKVTDPMVVTDKNTRNPVQGAYVELFIFSPSLQDYTPITPEMFPLSDSQFTDQNGEASYVLPNARYLARISAPGFNKQEVEFTIGAEKGEELPRVLLVPSGLNFFTFFTYYGAILWRECQRYAFSLQEYAKSHNLFAIAAFFTMAAFIVLTFMSFHKRLKIPILHFGKYFHHIVAKSHISKVPSHPTMVRLAEKEFASVVFEYLLVSSFILEIFFTAVFGLPKTAPFLILSVLNLILWILHLVHEDRNCAK